MWTKVGAVAGIHIPSAQVLGSPMTISGLMAILLTLVLPDGPDHASAG